MIRLDRVKAKTYLGDAVYAIAAALFPTQGGPMIALSISVVSMLALLAVAYAVVNRDLEGDR